jgi:hypothetical protein
VAFPQIAAFARLANGDVAPVRRVAGQATLISRADHDLEYDSVNDELVVGNPEGGAILVFRGAATGEEPPVRVIQGPHTKINDPGYGTFVDPVHNELFVCEKEYILVFPRTAKGDVPPIRVIEGPDTMLKNARGIQVDPVRNVIFAATNNGVLLFNRTDNGNVRPRAAIKGPMSGIRTTIQNFRLSPKGYLVAVLNSAGRRGVDDESSRPRGGIIAWSMDEMAAAQGAADIAPRFVLSNAKGRVEGQRIAINPKAKEVMVGGERAVEVYSFPEIF